MNMLYKVKRCSYCNNANVTLEEYELCDKCDEIIFNKIKEELNKGVKSPKELANSVGVSLKLIDAYMKDDRLIDVKKENDFHTCKYCGDAIDSGDICNNCLNKIKLRELMMNGNSSNNKSVNNNDTHDHTIRMHTFRK